MSLEMNGANVVQARVVNEGEHLHVPEAVTRKQFYTAEDRQIDPKSQELHLSPRIVATAIYL